MCYQKYNFLLKSGHMIDISAFITFGYNINITNPEAGTGIPIKRIEEIEYNEIILHYMYSEIFKIIEIPIEIINGKIDPFFSFLEEEIEQTIKEIELN